MSKHHCIWGTSIGALIAYDVHCARRNDDSTLSCVVRSHLHDRPRQAAFVGAWLTLTAWFVPHILTPVLRQGIEDVMEAMDPSGSMP